MYLKISGRRNSTDTRSPQHSCGLSKIANDGMRSRRLFCPQDKHRKWYGGAGAYTNTADNPCRGFAYDSWQRTQIDTGRGTRSPSPLFTQYYYKSHHLFTSLTVIVALTPSPFYFRLSFILSLFSFSPPHLSCLYLHCVFILLAFNNSTLNMCSNLPT